jgi:hypothetical protein
MMVRPALLVACAAALLTGLTGEGRAQPGCQATIMKPCAPAAPRPDTNAADASKPNGANKSDQTQAPSRRGIPVAPDTTFGLGARGLGLSGKF